MTKKLPRFRAISLSLVVCAAAWWNVKTRDGDLIFFQNLYVTCGLKMMIVQRTLRAILYIAWSSDFSRDFKPFLSLRLSARRLGVDPGRRSNIFQNLLGWPFGHARSYMLIDRQGSCAILNIPRDLSLFDCRRGCSEKRVDPGRRSKIFQNL